MAEGDKWSEFWAEDDKGYTHRLHDPSLFERQIAELNPAHRHEIRGTEEKIRWMHSHDHDGSYHEHEVDEIADEVKAGKTSLTFIDIREVP